MITEIKKGNKACYNGFLLGKKEYCEYLKCKQYVQEIAEMYGGKKE